MQIRITQMEREFEALGAYLEGSIKDGCGEIRIDFEGVESEEDLTLEEKKQVIAHAIEHEVHHALSDFFGLPLEDPDGMCGGYDNQVMYIVPLEEHEAIVREKDEEIERLKKLLE